MQIHNFSIAKENSKRGAEVIVTISLTSKAMKILRSNTKKNFNQQLSLPICPAGKLPPDPKAKLGQFNTKGIKRAQHQATIMEEFCC